MKSRQWTVTCLSDHQSKIMQADDCHCVLTLLKSFLLLLLNVLSQIICDVFLVRCFKCVKEDRQQPVIFTFQYAQQLFNLPMFRLLRLFTATGVLFLTRSFYQPLAKRHYTNESHLRFARLWLAWSHGGGSTAAAAAACWARSQRWSAAGTARLAAVCRQTEQRDFMQISIRLQQRQNDVKYD